MAVDYDLIVIGSSPEGIYAATTAVYLQARVALVTQNCKGTADNLKLIANRTLSEIAYLANLTQQGCFGLDVHKTSLSSEGLKAAKIWSAAICDNLNQENSLATLAALGVDVIEGEGEFSLLTEPELIVERRKLRSRAYLLATGSDTVVDWVEGSQEVDYFTVAEVLTKPDLVSLPHSLVIVGNSPQTLELTQSLARLGKQITLILEKKRILPQEDRAVSQLIQAQLEAEGVKILTASPVTQIKHLEGNQWLQAGTKAIATEAIIFTGRRKPNIAGLNLAAVEVKYNDRRIKVNRLLQTTNPRIYACGDLLGGYSLPHLARYEANIALTNALFLPWFKVDYRCLPWAIFTEPNLARVGMNEAQARKQYGDRIYVINQSFRQLVQAQILEETTGFCQLVVHRDGEILGCTIVAHQAAELIGAIALAMKQKIKLNKNMVLGQVQVDFPDVSPSLAEIWQQMAIAFYRQKLQNSPNWRKVLNTWFNWRRN